MKMRRSYNNRKGFTLTELAIVMGIIGSILSAIWIASARVSRNQKVDQAVQQILFIVEGIKNAFPNGNLPSGQLTPYAINSGIISSDVVRTCTGAWGTSGQGNGGCAYHPWGAQIMVGSQTGWGGLTSSNSRIEVVLDLARGIPCTAFLTAMLQQAVSDGLVNIRDEASGITAVTSSTSATTFTSCTSTGTGGKFVGFQFQL